MDNVWKYSEDKSQIVLTDGKPNRLLKVTGTRFASILGLNSWSTPFQMWCEITKSARLPFEGSKYTEAGKAIEPLVIDYLKKNLYANTLDAEEYYGMAYRNLRFDYFAQESKIYGGMWDAVLTKKNLTTKRALVEIKTTKRSQDWIDGPPIYYMLQVCLYAYLSNLDDFYLTVTFLQDDDYNHPEEFIVTSENTKKYKYKLSEQVFTLMENGEPHNYNFNELVAIVDAWYNTYIKTGISPTFDEDKDKEYLKILRKASPKNDNSVDQVIEELNRTMSLINGIKKDKGLKELEDREKTLKDNLKVMLKGQCGENDTSVQMMNWSYAKAKDTIKVDEKKLKADGIYDNYSVTKEGSWRLTQKKVED